MDEYAVTFFTMLEYGYMAEAESLLMLATVASVPHMDEKDRKQFLRDLEQSAKGVSGILNTDTDDYSGIDKLKEMFGQK